MRRPPWFAPHHSATAASVLGGGTGRVRPGQVSLAHHGVLFLDEFPHFRADVVEAMRQPLESGEVTIARGEESATYPARSLVVLAANPCPCGNFHGLSGGSCECTELQRSHYRRKLTRSDPRPGRHLDGGATPGSPAGAVLRAGAGVLRRRASPGGRGQAAPGPPLPRLRVAPQRLLSRSGPRRAVAARARRAALVDTELARRQAHPPRAHPRAAPGLDGGRLRGRGRGRGSARPRSRSRCAPTTAARTCRRAWFEWRLMSCRTRAVSAARVVGSPGPAARCPRPIASPGWCSAVRWSRVTARRRPWSARWARSARWRGAVRAERKPGSDAGASGSPRSTRSASSSRPPAAASASSSRATPSGRPALDELDDVHHRRGRSAARRRASG